MEKMWTPQFDNLRLYLQHHPGRRVVSMDIDSRATIPVDVLWPALRAAVGATRVGETVQLRGLSCTVERINSAPGPNEMLVRATAPSAGHLNIMAWNTSENTSTAMIAGRFFSDDADAYVARERDGWKQWLDRVVESASRDN
jgi:hypothetical protein